MSTPPVIERSLNRDLDAILAWMRADAAAGVPGSFLCNWSVIEQQHERGNVLVYRRSARGAPIAFQVDRHLIDGIMQVRSKYRGTGVGMALALHCLALAEAEAQPLVWLQCAPETSASFWGRLGFDIVWQGHKLMAYRQLEASFPRPPSATDAEVEIEFQSSDAIYYRDHPHGQRYSMTGWLTGNHLQLPRRIGAFSQVVAPDRDLTVRVLVNGTQVFHDKAKRPAAAALGIRICRGGAFVESLRL